MKFGKMALLAAMLSTGYVAPLSAQGVPESAKRPAIIPKVCKPVAGIDAVCLNGPAEDMVTVPGTPWLIVSGELRAVNVRTGRSVPLYNATPRWDKNLYGQCPGGEAKTVPNDLFQAHGIEIRPGAGKVHTIYAVHHSGTEPATSRESIEAFDLDVSNANAPKLRWTGCVVVPATVNPNSVAALPNGGFVVTDFVNQKLGPLTGEKARTILASGGDTGSVFEWGPARGWREVPGSQGSAPNGIAASPDGQTLYVSMWGSRKLVAVPRSGEGGARWELPLDFLVDNLRWDGEGHLLATGQHTDVNGLLTCYTGQDCTPVTAYVVRIDPQTHEHTNLVTGFKASEDFALATSAIKVNDQLWVSSVISPRILKFKK
jgi:hypothetical protein